MHFKVFCWQHNGSLILHVVLKNQKQVSRGGEHRSPSPGNGPVVLFASFPAPLLHISEKLCFFLGAATPVIFIGSRGVKCLPLLGPIPPVVYLVLRTRGQCRLLLMFCVIEASARCLCGGQHTAAASVQRAGGSPALFC